MWENLSSSSSDDTGKGGEGDAGGVPAAPVADVDFVAGHAEGLWAGFPVVAAGGGVGAEFPVCSSVSNVPGCWFPRDGRLSPQLRCWVRDGLQLILDMYPCQQFPEKYVD